MNDLTTRRPPYDPLVAAALAAMHPEGAAPAFEVAAVPFIRSTLPVEEMPGFEGERRDLELPGHDGDPIEISVFTPAGVAGASAALFVIHGGGMIFGDRLSGLAPFLGWATELGMTVVTVDYRLAPEFPDPYPVEDSYAALNWVTEHAAELGIDPARIIVTGGSAGAGIAAGVALLARDRGGPALLGQLLMYPMLDDRDRTPSTLQFDGIGVWDRGNNVVGWTALLGERRASEDVSIYAAPARATDLSGLPPTFIDVGSAEVFRDECVAFATQCWADGVAAELHVWPGGTHGWEVLAPGTRMVELAQATRTDWLIRLLAASADSR